MSNSERMHHFSKEGRNFVVDPNSLFLFERKARSGWSFRKNSTDKLYPISFLPLRTRDFQSEIRAEFARRKRGPDYTFLNISHSCNLKCVYCFAKGGNYNGLTALMDQTTAKNAVDAIISSCMAPTVTINFFGGEPLLNSSVLYATISYAIDAAIINRKTLNIIVTTNGTKSFCELGNRLNGTNHRIAISIDGPRDTHNLQRPFRNGRPSYDTITGNIMEYIEQFGAANITAKSTWKTQHNDLVSLVANLKSIGFHSIYLSKETHFTNGNANLSKTQGLEDLPAVLKAYDNLARWYVGELNVGTYLIIRPLYTIMRAILYSEIIRYRCMAGTRGWCVVPQGSIYPCHRFVEHKEYILGSVYSSDKLSVKLVDELASAEMLTPPLCLSCWAQYWCFSNRCVYQNVLMEQKLWEINQPQYCSFMRELLELICFHISNLNKVGKKIFNLKKMHNQQIQRTQKAAPLI